ncbi:MAG TPA: hypothetical protein VF666_13070 [Pyrinomonadaceae bacterium]|jgi:hypothetical protein
MTPQPHTRTLTIIAQDPGVKIDNKILTAEVRVPAEVLYPGPRGYRVQVIDYDASTDTLYAPLRYPPSVRGQYLDPFRKASDDELISNPQFHAQNVYAIVMRTLARFEFALGRRVGWSFAGHQIMVAPHAFADANAFYSERDRALMFGYFPALDGRGTVFSCLSHDVVAHETTHALVDGLRTYFTDPSSPEQAGFHEGFSDVVALLSVFSLTGVVAALLDVDSADSKRIERTKLTRGRLRQSVLLGLAEQMGEEMSRLRGQALRRSVALKRSSSIMESEEFQEPHRRGEILVAAMLNAFIEVWIMRLKGLGDKTTQLLDRKRVAEEGADAASHLLTMAIRALDYTPPTDLEFCDFLSALLSADMELVPDDSKYGYRAILRESFSAYGIEPSAVGSAEGYWKRPDCALDYTRTHFVAMQRDPDEIFRFLWENRTALGLNEDAYTSVNAVRPCLRIGPDGFVLHETIADYVQIVTLRATELRRRGIEIPAGMPDQKEVTIYGGGALVFDEYGQLKYHVSNRVLDAERQSRRLRYLWRYGYFHPAFSELRRFSSLHRRRARDQRTLHSEVW